MKWKRIALAILALLVALVLALLQSTDWLASFGGRPEGARLARIHASPQWVNGRFRNKQTSPLVTTSNREMLRRWWFGKEQREPLHPIPVVHARPANASPLRATWLGWSTVLVEIDGRRVLTDPVWSERCSPSTLIGPKRFHEPPIALADLPHIDVVVISHDHYDHLDMSAVRTLAARGTHFVVPLGIGAHLERWRVPPARITELDWNESIRIAGLTITATPSRHYSGRRRSDNQTLWASWVVKGPQHRFYFSGDTGYFDAFTPIGRDHGPFDLTLIKIGAYDPSWSGIHMNPEEAVQAYIDLGSHGVMLPVHWATFNLAFHPWREPADRTVAAARKAGITLVMPRPGEPIDIATPPPIVPWWAGASPAVPPPPRRRRPPT